MWCWNALAFPSAVGEGMEMCRDGGKYLVLGHYCDAGPVLWNPHVITRKQLQVFGSWSSEPRHLQAAIDFLRANQQRFPFREMVSHRFTLERANEALALTAGWQAAKSVFVPSHGQRIPLAAELHLWDSSAFRRLHCHLSTHEPHQIDPLILQKLQAFSQRRRQLILRRGIYAAGTTLLATMMLVAFIDWLFVLPDAVRWALSGAAYLAIIVVEWRSCLRLLISAPGPRRLARLVEHAEPKLREDLLSAVELGEAQPDAVFDSEQFRALVQSDVAARVEKLDMEQLLPAQLLRRYAFIAAGIGVACVVAFALTGFQFGTLMMRALLPMANFARVSKVQVKIVEPAPAEMRVPQGDTLPLIVELSGQRANKAMLETFTPERRARGRADESARQRPLFRDDPGRPRECALSGAGRRCADAKVSARSGGASGGRRVSKILHAIPPTRSWRRRW